MPEHFSVNLQHVAEQRLQQQNKTEILQDRPSVPAKGKQKYSEMLSSRQGLMDLYLYAMVVRTEAFEGCAVELLLVVRMGDADEKLCTFLH